MARTKLAVSKNEKVNQNNSAKKQVAKPKITKRKPKVVEDKPEKRRLLSSYKKEELAQLARDVDSNLSEDDIEKYSKSTLAKIAGVRLKAVKFNTKNIKNNYFYISRAGLFRLVKTHALKKLEKNHDFKISAKFLDNLNDILLSQISSVLSDAREITANKKRETTTGQDVILAANIRRFPWVMGRIQSVDFPLTKEAKAEIKAVGLKRLSIYSGIKTVAGCNYNPSTTGEPTFYEAVSYLYGTLLMYIVKDCLALLKYGNKKTFTTKELQYVSERIGTKFYEKN